jgi:glycosyltransferase involved in cell wall biosynthesis
MNTESALSIVIPVLNEEKTILKTLVDINCALKDLVKFEIIVVDDGSTDGTSLLLQKNKALFTKVVTLQRNFGKGKAVIVGIQNTSFDYVLIQDADLEYDPLEIPRLWSLVRKNSAEILTTSRLIGGEITRVHYFWHKIGNRFITLVFNLMNNTTFTDIYSGYIIFNKNLIETDKLKFFGWGQQAEILTFLVKKSNKIYETPISYNGRTYSEGKKIRASAIFEVLLAIVFTKLRKHLCR